jgi:hypothetical protein
MSTPRPGQIVAFILFGELAAFLILLATGSLEQFGPALVATIISANLFILGLVVTVILRRRKP